MTPRHEIVDAILRMLPIGAPESNVYPAKYRTLVNQFLDQVIAHHDLEFAWAKIGQLEAAIRQLRASQPLTSQPLSVELRDHAQPDLTLDLPPLSEERVFITTNPTARSSVFEEELRRVPRYETTTEKSPRWAETDDELDARLLEIFTEAHENKWLPMSTESVYRLLAVNGVLADVREAYTYPQHPLRQRVEQSFARLRQRGELRFMGVEPDPRQPDERGEPT